MTAVARKRGKVVSPSKTPEAPPPSPKSRRDAAPGRCTPFGDGTPVEGRDGGGSNRTAVFGFALLDRIVGAAFFGALIAGTLLSSEAVQYGHALPLATIYGLILAARCALAAWTGTPMPIGLIGLGVAGFALWTAISGAVVVFGETGDRRAAITMTLQWVGYAALFLAALALAREATFRRYALIALGASAAAWGAMGAYDYFIRLPAIADSYFELSDAEKREVLAANLEGDVDDPNARRRFEDRLRSVEPIATFSLTNSLAGFLLFGWIVSAYGTLREAFVRRRFLALAGWALIWLLASFVLFLTKSRTAWAAAALGGAALATLFLVREKRLPWKVLVAGVVGIALLGGVAYATGAVDREVVTEAAKSFAYRLEYWRSTLAMIGERPLLGTGPGNFGPNYLHEKLPQASEEVKDPHQWLLEIASTVGLPGAALLTLALAVAVVAGLATWLRRENKAEEGADERVSTEAFVSSEPAFLEKRPFAIYDFGVACGAIVGFLLTILFLMPLDMTMGAVGLWAFVLARWALGKVEAPSAETAGVGALAAATVLLHLSASGGIAYPGIAPWLLLVVALAAAGSSTRASAGRLGAAGLALGAAIFACFVQYAAVPPVLPTGAALTTSQEAARSLRDGFLPMAEREAQQALALDPHLANVREFPPPAEILIDVRWNRFMASPDEARLEALLAAIEEAIDRDPENYSPYRFAGGRLLAAGAMTGNSRALDEAVRRLEQAVERYPNSATLRAQLAVALAANGEREEAEDSLAEAERLDALNPHEDRRLARQRLDDPFASARTSTAGEWIERFRSAAPPR